MLRKVTAQKQHGLETPRGTNESQRPMVGAAPSTQKRAACLRATMQPALMLLAAVLCVQIIAALGFHATPDMVYRGVVSIHEVQPILALRKQLAGATTAIRANLSIDLSLSREEVLVTSEGLAVPSGDSSNLLASWEELEDIAGRKKGSCFALYEDGSVPYLVSGISERTNNPGSLHCANAGAPTMILGGFTMHRIAGDNMNPTVDTAHKIASLPLHRDATVLDTCCGLGYTSIEAAKKGCKVTTIEFDPLSLELCHYNPWSRKLFDGSADITVKVGDACELVRGIPDGSFSYVIHDPPARNLCSTDLYGLDFYRELRRVLKTNGQLYHYIGNPTSKESGKLFAGIISRLGEAGFAGIKKADSAFGLVASASKRP